MKTLEQLFHMDPSSWQSEYHSRFYNADTVHLDILINDKPAFVFMNSELYRRMLSIARKDKELSRLTTILPGRAIHHFIDQCLVEEIVQSNQIEGVYSTRKQIGAILHDLSKSNRKERFYGLVRKYELLKRNISIPLSCAADIRTIYDDIFLDEIQLSDSSNLPDGTLFRKNSVSVYSPTQKEIHVGLLPESKIIQAVEQSLRILQHDSIDPLIRIAVFHYLFGYIHPFYDGNGRTSRFISSYLLTKFLSPLIGLRLSYTIKDNVRRYYDAFKICNHPNNCADLTPFVDIFLEFVETSAEQLCNLLQLRVKQYDHYQKRLSLLPYGTDKDMNRLYSLLIQASLFSHIGISMPELSQYMGTSTSTVRSRMEKIPPSFLIRNLQNRHPYYLLDLNQVDSYLSKE